MSYVVLNDAGLFNLLKSNTGGVAKFIDRKAEQIYQNAHARIGHIPAERSGDLRASLRKVPLSDSDGYHVAVGTDAHHSHGRSGPFPYARALETGINPLTGAAMHFTKDFAYMVPAVRMSGFRRRSL